MLAGLMRAEQPAGEVEIELVAKMANDNALNSAWPVTRDS